jgi:tetratricopeptide (TPR) repeat protein
MKLKYHNIKTAVVVLFLVFSTSFNAHSQNKIQVIEVKNNQIQISKGNVIVDFTILFNNVEVTSNNQLTLIPVIKTTEGKHQLPLQPVIVNGKKRHNLYIRSLHLNGKKNDPAVYSVLLARKRGVLGTFSYKTKIPFEPWMKEASVYLTGNLCGCAGSEKDDFEKLISASIALPEPAVFDYTYVPAVNFITPPKEKIKERAETGEAYLVFKQSKWDIIPNLFDNNAELAKIERSLNYVEEEPTAVITKISIKAYASPEGKYDENLVLSKKRAKSLLDYVQQNHDLSAGIEVFSEGYGEDWDRLIALIEKDPKLENKEQVLHVISSVGIFDGREKQLMELAGGRPYLYMLDKFFPLLRRSDYKIEYTVPVFSIEKGKQLLKTKPEMVGLEEMYLIANTYEKGSQSFNEVFDVAGKVYPNDVIAIVNAATVAILEGKNEYAGKLLEKYTDKPAAWNNLGIVYMSKHRVAEAENYFNKAISQGSKEAEHNLNILEGLKNALEKYESQKEDYERY